MRSCRKNEASRYNQCKTCLLYTSVRDCAAHHHLVEIAWLQSEVTGCFRGGHQITFTFHIRSFYCYLYFRRIGICCFFRLFLSSVSDAKLRLLQGGPMGDEWGKCMKRKCAIPLCMNGIAHSYNAVSYTHLFRYT